MFAVLCTQHFCTRVAGNTSESAEQNPNATSTTVSVDVVSDNKELPPGGTFADDDGTVHEGNIEAIAARGITRGCNPPANDSFCPNDAVTRGQMAAFLDRAFGFGLYPPTIDYFVEDNDSVFEADINAIAGAGVTKGCDALARDRYCPGDEVTRGQMAAFIVRALGLTGDGGKDSFSDDDGPFFESDINRLAAAGITKGCNPPTNDEFCPNEPVTRRQMASFLARALGLTPIIPPPSTITQSPR